MTQLEDSYKFAQLLRFSSTPSQLIQVEKMPEIFIAVTIYPVTIHNLHKYWRRNADDNKNQNFAEVCAGQTFILPAVTNPASSCYQVRKNRI